MSPHEIYQELIAIARQHLTNTEAGRALELAMPLETNKFLDSMSRNMAVAVDNWIHERTFEDEPTAEHVTFGHIGRILSVPEPHIEDIISAEMSRCMEFKP
jgi:hypothetical protein